MDKIKIKIKDPNYGMEGDIVKSGNSYYFKDSKFYYKINSGGGGGSKKNVTGNYYINDADMAENGRYPSPFRLLPSSAQQSAVPSVGPGNSIDILSGSFDVFITGGDYNAANGGCFECFFGSGNFNIIANSYYGSILGNNNMLDTISHGTVAGYRNIISLSEHSSIVNGSYSSINKSDNAIILNGTTGCIITSDSTNSFYSSILNGQDNIIKSAGSSNLIVNGKNNFINGNYSSILSGSGNTAIGDHNGILGGYKNKLTAGSAYSSILCGYGNSSNSQHSVILCGFNNSIDSANKSAILSGSDISLTSADENSAVAKKLRNIGARIAHVATYTFTQNTEIYDIPLDTNIIYIKSGGYFGTSVKIPLPSVTKSGMIIEIVIDHTDFVADVICAQQVMVVAYPMASINPGRYTTFTDVHNIKLINIAEALWHVLKLTREP